jgi:hypothetical protein
MFLFLTIPQHFAGNNNKKKFVNNCCFGKCAFLALYGNNPATIGWQQFDNKLILGLMLNPAVVWQHFHNNDVWQQILHGNNQLPK